MKKISRRNFLQLASAGAATAGLSACGSSTSNSAAASNSASSAAPVEENPNISLSGEFPIAKEQVVLNVMAAQQSNVSDLIDNEFTKMLEEKTNIKLNWNIVPVANAGEKLNVVLSTGANLPDVLLGFDINMSQQIAIGDSQGMFVDMMPYLDKYGNNIQQVFAELPVLERIAKTPSGKLLSMLGAEETYHVKYPQKAWVNKAFLEKTGMDLPTTTDDFTEFLRTIKNGDCNGNGKADEIPFTGGITGWNTFVVPFVMSAFVDYMQASGVTGSTDKAVTKLAFYIEDSEIRPSFILDGWKQGLKYMNSLVEEGLLDPLSFTQDGAQLKAAVASEPRIVGVAAGGATGAISATVDIQEEYQIALKPLAGPDGHCYTFYSNISAGIGKYAITKACKNVEAAVRLCDFLVSQEGSIPSLYGVEGRDWNYVDDPSKLGLNGEPAVFELLLKFGKQTNAHWSKMAPQIMPDRLRNGMAVNATDEYDTEQNLYKQTKEKYEPLSDGKYLLPLTLKEELTSEFVDLQTPISSYLDQMTSKFIIGEINIDEGWDDYVAELEKMNLHRYIEIINESYLYAYGEEALTEFI